MRPYVVFSSKRSELNHLSSVFSFLFKKRGEWETPLFVQGLNQLQECLEDPLQLKMLVCDVTVEGAIAMVEQLRSRNEEMRLVLLADQTVSPVTYIRPTVLPTALLWRPLQPQSAAETLWSVLCLIPKTDAAPTDGDQEAFSVETRGEVRRIPYSHIRFFEARNKRLYVHTERKEIPFNGTLETLTETLPDTFIRVHKSFIINRLAVTELQFGQNTVVLDGDLMIPISRSYKAQLKAVFA